MATRLRTTPVLPPFRAAAVDSECPSHFVAVWGTAPCDTALISAVQAEMQAIDSSCQVGADKEEVDGWRKGGRAPVD